MPATPDPTRAPFRQLALAVALATGALAVLALVAPALRVTPIAAFVVTYTAATAAIVAGTGVAPLADLRAWRTALGAAAVGLASMACGYLLARGGHHATSTEVLAGLVGTAGVLVAGTSIGAAVGSRIAHPGHLTAVALASSAADIWSVHSTSGITHAIIVTPDVALQRLFFVSAALPPSRVPEAVIGLGDVIFAALYGAASVRHGLPRARTVAAVTVGLVLAGASVIKLQVALPALPFIGAMVLLAQPTTRKIAPGDRGPTAFAGLLLVGSIVRVLLVRRG